jgi:multicomponent Na+:H+ antiporter subunit F
VIDTLAFLEAVTLVCMAVLAVAFAIAFLRLARGPTVPDRVVGLELMTTIFVCVVAVWSISSRQTVYLDVAIVLALVGFLSAVAFARFIALGRRSR